MSVGPYLTLVHSPLVGWTTWHGVEASLRRRNACPWTARIDITRLTAPFDEAIGRVVAAQVPDQERGAVVLHSAAGLFAGGIADAYGDAPMVFVDALLPAPGKSWFDTAPPPLAAHICQIADKGWLAPWPTWFGASTMARLIPDEAIRAAFVADCTEIPMHLLEAPNSSADVTGPHAYLQLSDSYTEEADIAADRGWLVRREPMHHLAMLSDPDRVAEILLELLEEMRAR